MVQNPPEGYQRVIPYLLYDDAPAAIDFLCRTFGFEERFRFPMPDGKLGHAELALGDNVLMLASAHPGMGHQSQRALPGRSSFVSCYVDGVDEHFARAKAAGAKIVEGLQDQFYGDRSYRAEDPEGHLWVFATHVRDVPPEEMQPPG